MFLDVGKSKVRGVLEYKTGVAKISDSAEKVSRSEYQSFYPPSINSVALRSLFDALEDVQFVVEPQSHYDNERVKSKREAMTLAVDRAVRRVKKSNWRGDRFKETKVRNAIKGVLQDDALVDAALGIVRAQHDY